jgi:UDP-glucose 4-epimerase
MAKILIIGGAGFIGSYCCRNLLGQGNDEVFVFDGFVNYCDRLSYDYERQLALRFSDLREKVKVMRGDVRYKLELNSALQEVKPEIVIHLAAIPDARKSNQFPEAAIDINLNGTVNVLEAVRRTDSVKRFVFASSSFVYGDFQYEPADETHPTEPIDVYGGTKLGCEVLTKAYGRKFGFDWTIVRPSAVYGPGDSYDRVSKVFVESALQGKPLVLFNGGKNRLDFTYVSDTAAGIVLAAKSEKAANEIFNITAGGARSIKEFAMVVAKNLPGVQLKEMPSDDRVPERGTVDIKKAKKLLGFKPRYTIEQGIPNYIRGVKENKAVE